MSASDPNSRVISLMRSVLTEPFLIDITRAIAQSYRDADMSCSDIHPRFIKQGRPQKRRDIVDTRLEAVSRRHFNINSLIKDNVRKSACYTELTVAECVILTASSTRFADELPRPSKFRLQAAARNPTLRQMEIFDNLVQADFQNRAYSPVSSLEMTSLYGIIIHGPSQGESPGYIRLAVPDSDYKFFVGTIDLLGNYLSEDVDEAQGDLAVQEIPRPSARIRIRPEVYVEDEDQVEGEGRNSTREQ